MATAQKGEETMFWDHPGFTLLSSHRSSLLCSRFPSMSQMSQNVPFPPPLKNPKNLRNIISFNHLPGVPPRQNAPHLRLPHPNPRSFNPLHMSRFEHPSFRDSIVKTIYPRLLPSYVKLQNEPTADRRQHIKSSSLTTNNYQLPTMLIPSRKLGINP